MNNFVPRSILRNAKYKNLRLMATKKEDVCIHTGQKWDFDDYRMVRFINAPKVVNPSWAVKLIADIPPIPIKGRKVWCDGGSGAEGHPRIYINLDAPGPQFCMYCSQGFFQEHPKPKPKPELCDPCKKN